MLVWTDLETSGLDPGKCSVLEVAAIITDDDLNEVARFQRVVYWEHAADIVDIVGTGRAADDIASVLMPRFPFGCSVDPYVVEMHTKNGLWKDVVYGQALDTVDRDFAAFIEKHAVKTVEYTDEKTGEKKTRLDRPQLAGSTISFDRGFIDTHLPRAAAQLHYRNLDVSSFNETAKRFWKDLYAARPNNKDKAHRGMADIEESIRVYKHYLAHITYTWPTPPSPDQLSLPAGGAA